MIFHWDDIKRDFKAEARSRVVKGFVSVGLLVLLYLARHYLPPAALDPNTHEATFQSVWGWITKYPILELKNAIKFGAALFLGAVAFVLLVRFVTEVILHISKLYDSLRLRKVIGLSAFWPNANTDNKGGTAWQRIESYIVDRQNPILFILGATGIATFGGGSALHEIVQKFHGEIRILLMDHKSQHLKARALSLNMSEVQYRREIAAAIRQIKDWKREGRNVEYRTYDSVPNWKLILTKDVAWVQYYHMATHVDGTPVYHFYATADRTGMYHLFLAEFRRIWKLCAEGAEALGSHRD